MCLPANAEARDALYFENLINCSDTFQIYEVETRLQLYEIALFR